MESSIRADGPISRSSNQIVTFTDRNLDFFYRRLCVFFVCLRFLCVRRARFPPVNVLPGASAGAGGFRSGKTVLSATACAGPMTRDFRSSHQLIFIHTQHLLASADGDICANVWQGERHNRKGDEEIECRTDGITNAQLDGTNVEDIVTNCMLDARE